MRGSARNSCEPDVLSSDRRTLVQDTLADLDSDMESAEKNFKINSHATSTTMTTHWPLEHKTWSRATVRHGLGSAKTVFVEGDVGSVSWWPKRRRINSVSPLAFALANCERKLCISCDHRPPGVSPAFPASSICCLPRPSRRRQHAIVSIAIWAPGNPSATTFQPLVVFDIGSARGWRVEATETCGVKVVNWFTGHVDPTQVLALFNRPSVFQLLLIVAILADFLQNLIVWRRFCFVMSVFVTDIPRTHDHTACAATASARSLRHPESGWDPVFDVDSFFLFHVMISIQISQHVSSMSFPDASQLGHRIPSSRQFLVSDDIWISDRDKDLQSSDQVVSG